MAMSAGYYRFPTIFNDRVVFTSDDDLWEVPLQGGRAQRLTSGLGESVRPAFSPCGQWLAFTSNGEGNPEAFIMPSEGGPARRLTYLGVDTATVGFSPDGKVIITTTHGQAFQRPSVLFEVPAEGGEPAQLPWGPAASISFQASTSTGDGIVIARNADDIGRWKRYRGGAAGCLWVTEDGEQWNRLFPEIESGFCRPMWIMDRIFFISDMEDHGNLYSCLPDGSDLKRHTHHEGFYVRFATHHNGTIVYSLGGSLRRYTIATDEDAEINIVFPSPRTQLDRRFAEAAPYLDDIALHPSGHSMAIVTRGSVFNFGHWEGAVRQTGVTHGVGYRMPLYLDRERLLIISDEGGEEHFEVHYIQGVRAPERLEVEVDFGRPIEQRLSNKGVLAFSNHRHELCTLDLQTGEALCIDRSAYERIEGLGWSEDGRYLAYSFANTSHTALIRVYDTQTQTRHDVTTGEFKDVAPTFDPLGRYLYFLSFRFFEPVQDQIFFEVSFPASMKPCLVTLRPDVPSPFIEKPRALEDEEDSEAEEEEETSENTETEGTGESEGATEEVDESLVIDFEGIEHRIDSFPVAVAEYVQIDCTEDRVFWTVFGINSGEEESLLRGPKPAGRVGYYSLKDHEVKVFSHEVDGFRLGPDRKTMAIWGEGLRIVSATAATASDEDDDTPGRKSGWVDLGRISLLLDVRSEWRQMLREAWRLMRDHFWDKDLGGIDWDDVWARYSPLVELVSTRSEFSDVVWTMQGELGTSHAYELGGDYRRGSPAIPGFLGADLVWDEDGEGYRIAHIARGDAWSSEGSPLARVGVDARVGDVVLGINGQRVIREVPIQQYLLNLAGQEIELVLKRGDAEPHAITVKTLYTEVPARYREWVLRNRAQVHAASNNTIGYIHIPDMSLTGFAEFHRAFLQEVHRGGLIVDVRNNAGGYVSQLLLEKLARRRLGYDISRWGAAVPYPNESIRGPIVAIADEHAGSDGDIFTHCFKLMNLGPVVGKRTWGGVVGVWPRHGLVDGSVTTQPEFSFWFRDVGFSLENQGTRPDVDVEIAPQDYTRSRDTQLEAAITTILSLPVPEEVTDFGPPPPLLPRPLKR